MRWFFAFHRRDPSLKPSPKFGYSHFAFGLIGLGIVARLLNAVSTLDIMHPDEHFQTLEPAAHAVYGFGWLAWEWTAGSRSWFVPGLYMPILGFFKWIGIIGGPA